LAASVGEHRPHGVQGIRVARRLVLSPSEHPRKANRNSRPMARRRGQTFETQYNLAQSAMSSLASKPLQASAVAALAVIGAIDSL
jgi:hypothetical protein